MKLLRGEKKYMFQDRGIRFSGRRMGQSPSQSIIQSKNTSESMSPTTYNFTKPARKQNRFVNFTLDRVLRRQIKLKQWSILLICGKIIDLYEQGIKKKQMSMQITATSICVYNFNEKYQSLLRVKFLNDGENETQESLYQQTLNIVKSLLELMLSQSKNHQFVENLLKQLSKHMRESKPSQVKAIKRMIDELIVLEEAVDSAQKKSLRYE